MASIYVSGGLSLTVDTVKNMDYILLCLKEATNPRKGPRPPYLFNPTF